MRPGGLGISRRIDSAVTLLPQPDSPTMPSVSPAPRRRTTRRPPPHRAVVACRSACAGRATSRTAGRAAIQDSASPSPCAGRARRETVAEEVERHHRQEDGEPGDEQPRERLERRGCSGPGAACCPTTPAAPGCRSPRNESVDLAQDVAGHRDRRGDDEERQRVGQDVADDDAQRARAQRPGGVSRTRTRAGRAPCRARCAPGRPSR